MRTLLNEVKMSFTAISENESFARGVAVSFASQASPTVTQLADIKCVVSEAVTNCIVHGYRETVGVIYITVTIYEGDLVKLEIKDKGVGIEDVKLARQPLYTTDSANERSGMGFTVMESFTDRIRVTSKPGKGTKVVMYKQLNGRKSS